MIAQMTNWAMRTLRRRSNYRATFQTQSGKEVLADLKRFCRGMQPPLVLGDGGVDTHGTAVAIGRQEVWLRIVAHLHLDDSQLMNLKETSDDSSSST
jgi:hypothetical protein